MYYLPIYLSTYIPITYPPINKPTYPVPMYLPNYLRLHTCSEKNKDELRVCDGPFQAACVILCTHGVIATAAVFHVLGESTQAVQGGGQVGRGCVGSIASLELVRVVGHGPHDLDV